MSQQKLGERLGNRCWRVTQAERDLAVLVKVQRAAAPLRSGEWSAARFALEATTRLLTDGTAETVQRAKCQDAAARQVLMRERLAGFAVEADPHAYHCWWRLPEPWRAETFVAAEARQASPSPRPPPSRGPGSNRGKSNEPMSDLR